MKGFTSVTCLRRSINWPDSLVSVLAIAMIVTGVVLGASAPSTANLVDNGGFEEPFLGIPLPFWTLSGNTALAATACLGPDPNVAEGNCAALFGPGDGTVDITQDLSTSAGQAYQIKFSFLPDGQTPSFFSASFGGVTLVSLTNPPASSYQAFSFTAVASSASTALAFTFRDDTGTLWFDAVSVDAAAAIPAPATVVLLGAGVLGLVAYGRRRRSP